MIEFVIKRSLSSKIVKIRWHAEAKSEVSTPDDGPIMALQHAVPDEFSPTNKV